MTWRCSNTLKRLKLLARQAIVLQSTMKYCNEHQIDMEQLIEKVSLVNGILLA